MWRKRMDNWGTEEKKKSGGDTARRVVLVMIVLVIIAIAAIAVLLINIQANTFKLVLDDKTVQDIPSNLLEESEDGTTYINIEQMAKILGVEYHPGEYKAFGSNADKCYVQSTAETASFYLNSNKICKLPVGQLKEDYDVLYSQKNVIEMNDGFYAPVDAIEKGFNVVIEEKSNQMSITTLDELLKLLNKNLNPTINDENSSSSENTEYLNFLEGESFNNKKAARYGYVVFFKNSSNLYGVMDTKGTEILPDKYKKIEFLESTQEFFVTNSLDKMGIIDASGNPKVEQNYDTIKLINREPKLYMVGNADKYGVVDENGQTIIFTEYDSIGVDPTIYTSEENQYILLNNAIPVCQNKKYGLFDITGKKIAEVQYDGIGYELDKVVYGENEKPVKTTVSIKECNGVVVKTGKKYGVLDATTGKELLPTNTDAVYCITNAGVNTYFYAFKNQEHNLIEDLIKAGRIESPNKLDTTIQNVIDTSEANNTVEVGNTVTVNQTVPANQVTSNTTVVPTNTLTTNQTAPTLNVQNQTIKQ